MILWIESFAVAAAALAVAHHCTPHGSRDFWLIISLAILCHGAGAIMGVLEALSR